MERFDQEGLGAAGGGCRMIKNEGFLLDEDGRIKNCSSNVAQMSVGQFMRLNLSVMARDLYGGILVACISIAKGAWFFFVSLLVGPFFLLGWPLIAANTIRTARQEMARKKACEYGSFEIYRVKFALFRTNTIRRWTYNILIVYLGLHRLVGIPNYDFSQRDRESGDMVYYRVKEKVSR
jgi:hypothetical protein